MNTCCMYCPISLIVERFLYILLNDVVWACGSLDGVWGMRESHSLFHYGRIR